MPAKQDEQVHWADNFFNVINVAVDHYGLTTEQSTAFGVVNDTLQTAYAAATNPATRTKMTVDRKNAALKDMKTMAGKLVSIIQGQPTVTSDQLIALGLTVRKTKPTPVPTPAQKPFIKIKSVDGRTVTLELRQNSARRGKPAQVASATVFTASGVNAPASMGDWSFYANANKTTFDIAFPPSATGDTVWVTAFWNNAKNVSGPAATAVSLNLAAGGVLPQESKAVKLRAA